MKAVSKAAVSAMKHRFLLFVLFALLLPVLGRAQESAITGRLIDVATQEPVPFACISLRGEGTRTLTNENGYFRLAGLEKSSQDSLLVQLVGYARRAIGIERGKGQDLRIEVSKWLIFYGPTLNSAPPFGYVPPFDQEKIDMALPGSQYAFYFQNETPKRLGNLRSVSFYIGNDGFPREPFRLRIYQVDSLNHAPKMDLLTEDVLVSAPASNHWYTVDLRDLDIVTPREGFFVALEFISSWWGGGIYDLEDYTPSGDVLRPFVDQEQRIWRYTIGKGWKVTLLPCGSRRYSAMIKVEVDAAK